MSNGGSGTFTVLCTQVTAWGGLGGHLSVTDSTLMFKQHFRSSGVVTIELKSIDQFTQYRQWDLSRIRYGLGAIGTLSVVHAHGKVYRFRVRNQNELGNILRARGVLIVEAD